MKTGDTDAILWKELKGGSITALGSLYDMYVDQLFLFGCKITSETNVVQDGIHDLFLDLYKYRTNLADTSNVKFYLLSSLKNKILKNPEYKILRSQQSTPLNNDIDLSISIEEEFIEEELFNERYQKFTEALQLLPKKQREGILLKFVQNKTYEEIAEIMNVKVETSRTIVYRGIKSLREICVFLMYFILSIW